MKFYISNDLELLTEQEAREKVIIKGGVIRDEVTNDIWYFVTNNSEKNSETFKIAKKLGILFIDEREFMKMLE